jgi:nitrogen fixation-related uncharacterized protein
MIQFENLQRNTAFNKTKAETENALRHDDMQRTTAFQKKSAENDQDLKDTRLKNSTDYQKQFDDLTNETKRITFERNSKFIDFVAKTNHIVKEENLSRDAEYQLLEDTTDNQ